MKMIKSLINLLDEELFGAQMYAERYVEEKVNENMKWASNFKAMSEDEMNHAMKIHEYTVEQINKLKKVYTPPKDMLDKWESAHKTYVEKTAWIKQMLTL